MTDRVPGLNLPANFGKKGYVGNPNRVKIRHPLASEISFFAEPLQENFCEAAFFIGDAWVLETIPELSAYAENFVGETRVYRYIPRQSLEDFLDIFAKDS